MCIRIKGMFCSKKYKKKKKKEERRGKKERREKLWEKDELALVGHIYR